MNGASTLPAGTYTVGYTFYNPSGQTVLSTTTTQAVTTGQSLQVAALTPLPTGATGVNYYISVAGGTTTNYVQSSAGGVTNILNLPLAGAAPGPTPTLGYSNTAYARGVYATAARRLYGTIEIQRGQAHRFAVEDRGSFVDKFRANPKLVEATFKLDCDATFEDLPYMLDTVLQGGVTPVATQAGAVQTWTYVPDQTKDTLTTRTFEVGAEDVQWRGQFATTDSADFTMSLDDALKVSFNGFTADWQPTGVNTWYGFSGVGGLQGAPPAAPVTPLADHAVESVMGYQCQLYIDQMVATDVIGTTLTYGRFISATWGYHNQNKRKYFGDNNTGLFSKLGRGRRQVHCSITFEGYDTVQFQQWTGNQPLAVRVAAIGTALAGATAPVVNKQQLYDFYGVWDTFQMGTRETNVTWQLDLAAMYSIPVALESRVTVVNGLTAAAAGF